MEGMYPVVLIKKVKSETSNKNGDTIFTTSELNRHAMRGMIQSAGSESHTAESYIEITGMVKYTIRYDDELNGINATWRLRDLITDTLHDIVSVTSNHIRGGEHRYVLHCKPTVTQ